MYMHSNSLHQNLISQTSIATTFSSNMVLEQRRGKIEEAVAEIITTGDLGTLTEYDIRVMLADRLSIDLTEPEQKLLVRRVLESYLLSMPEEQANVVETKEVVQQQSQPNSQLNSNNSQENRGDNSCRYTLKLSSRRSVSVKNFGEKTSVLFRESYNKNGKQFTASGIDLTADQWFAFKQCVPAIEEAIVQMNSRKRKSEGNIKSEADLSNKVPSVAQGDISVGKKQTEVCNKVTDVPLQGEVSTERKNTEAGDSNVSTGIASEEDMTSPRMANIAPNEQVKHNSLSAFPHGIIPIHYSRLNGRNYSHWKRQIYISLKQLNVAYVLTEPCPNIPQHEEASFEKNVQAKAAARKWIDDDHLCRVSILNSLCDHLYDQYSKKILTSKELWEELKLSFDYEFGTKQSQVNEYMQYQMVDGASILGQVQELHEIADTIIASGMWIDENFHVSAIVSKLPPSWKECRAKLMKEECLPLSKLMCTLKLEEDSRNRHRLLESSRHSKPENKFVPKTTEMKRLCYMCGKEGHMFKNCSLRKFVESSNRKKNNGDVPVTTEGNKIPKQVE